MRAQTLHRFVAPLLALAWTALAAAPAVAQQGDRRLLATGGGDPYVMILFDTSGSMAWGTECTADDRAIGRCSHDCPAPNCPRPMNGDDPDSKIYQAKDALYTVMKDVTGVRWGFASLNQDQLAVGNKHWLYEVTAVSGVGSPAIPAVGWQEVFGAQTGGSGNTAFDMTCDRNGGGNSSTNGDELYEMGCYMTADDAPDIDEDDFWTLEKLRRLPKGGGLETPASTYYFMRPTSGGANRPYYRFTYDSPVVDYTVTDTFDVTVTIQQCLKANVQANATSCGVGNNLWTDVGTRTVSYEKVGGFLWWEGTTSSDTSNNSTYQEDAYFGGRTDGEPSTQGGLAYASDVYADSTCRGWEPSGDDWGQSDPAAAPGETDPFTDGGTSYNLRWTTTGVSFDPPGTDNDPLFEYGDIIPLDWNNDNLTAVLKRLNPKHPTVDDESFAQEPYFADSYSPGENFLRLKTEDNSATTDTDEAIRPLVAHGSTPLAGWFSMFRHWYSGCGDPGNCDDDLVGWQDIAAQYDPNFACSKKYVLMITDGAETCDGTRSTNSEDYYEDHPEEFPDGFSKTADQCRYRASLSAQEDVETIVIGFGTENKAKLQCANTPVFFADTKGELVDLLVQLIGEIQEQAAAFASAAVPTVQANILDKVYLSSFVPLDDEAVWPGRLDSFLKPLPLVQGTNLPDRTADCGTTLQAKCFAWDAGDSQLAWDNEAGYDPQRLLLQAPLEADIDDGNFDNATLKLGSGEDQRRVFFGLPDSTTQKNRRMVFDFPADPQDPDDPSTEDYEPSDLANYEYAWNLTVSTPGTAQSDANRVTVANVVKFTLEEKQSIIESDDPDIADTHVQYVMGDIFHSNPNILNPPADFEYFTKDLYWDKALCGESVADTALRGPQISYAWYSNKNLCRRVSLFVGSNDGQLHSFDGGIFDTTDAAVADCKLPFAETADDTTLADTDITHGGFDFGSGREIFSFIPDAMMPVVKELSELSELTTQWGVDGSPLSADVFIDPYVAANGSPECEQRVWRTLLLANYREGGPGIVALDITQPDTFDTTTNVPLPASGTLDYVPSCLNGGTDCDTFCRQESGAVDTDCAELAYPALKWEFRDLDSSNVEADDDANGSADLAESWSRPFVARLSICDDDDCDEPADHFVAIFGGGISESPANDSSDEVGNWLYMVDVETGKLVYKRGGVASGSSSPIVGSVPSDITGVDANSNGYVDTLYFGTTAGYVYKVALGDGPFILDGDGLIDDLTVDGSDPDTDADADPGVYNPFQVFSTEGRSIYLEIGAVYVPKERTVALLFGTGTRNNLWNANGQEGRFYAILDENWQDTDDDGVVNADCTPACSGVLTEANYTEVDIDTGTPADYLYGIGTAEKGWFFALGENEKVITEAFTLTGISFFTVFDPLITEFGEDELCVFSGESKIFVVNTVTTEGYAIQAGSTDRERYFTAPTFTTQPYVEPSATKNPGVGTGENTADEWTDELKLINQELKRLFPSNARFANYTLDIKTIRSDTGVVFIAPVPIALEGHNWKEY